VTREEIEAQVRSIQRRCRGPLREDAKKVVRSLLADGLLEEAQRADEAGREYCGYDFNDIICSGPFDGKEHSYVCPKCGVTGKYIAPYDAGESSTGVAAAQPADQSQSESLFLRLRRRLGLA
jgi:hypothetical protein